MHTHFYIIMPSCKTFWMPLVSRRHIGQLMRNLDRKWRITCQHRSHEQNCNFRKFKIVVGRHFENSFISISHPWIIRFWSNLVPRCRFPFRGCTFTTTKNRNYANSRWRTDAILKTVCFLAISRRHIGRLVRNLDQRWKITYHVTKTAIL